MIKVDDSECPHLFPFLKLNLLKYTKLVYKIGYHQDDADNESPNNHIKMKLSQSNGL